MEKLKDYDVSFSGLSLGVHHFAFKITQSFFDLFKFEQEFSNPDLEVNLELDKKNNFLELDIHLKGKVELSCDITGEPFEENISFKEEIMVKFGEEYDFSDDEVWIIPVGENKINISQIVYEMALLSIPLKRIHPDVKNGTNHSEMIDLLNKYSPSSDNLNKIEEETDPRWEKLKALKKDNNRN